jgi:hypothetical protein
MSQDPIKRSAPDRMESFKPPRLLFGAIPPYDVQQRANRTAWGFVSMVSRQKYA